MKYKKLPEDMAKQITNYLKSINVPAIIGADLVAIANSIEKLEEGEDKKEVKK